MFTMPLEELTALYRADHEASGVSADGRGPVLSIVDYDQDHILAFTEISAADARKGGTIAGETIFRFFDAIGYLATLAQSPKGTEGFTTDVSIHFLRSGPVGRFDVEGRPLRFGRRASVVAVTVTSPQVPDGPIASGVITFAPIFPKVPGA